VLSTAAKVVYTEGRSEARRSVNMNTAAVEFDSKGTLSTVSRDVQTASTELDPKGAFASVRF
jgi:hypothetical protein